MTYPSQWPEASMYLYSSLGHLFRLNHNAHDQLVSRRAEIATYSSVWSSVSSSESNHSFNWSTLVGSVICLVDDLCIIPLLAPRTSDCRLPSLNSAKPNQACPIAITKPCFPDPSSSPTTGSIQQRTVCNPTTPYNLTHRAGRPCCPRNCQSASEFRREVKFK
jgi:hypothetical protein